MTTLGLIVLVGALPVVTGIVSAVRVATGLEVPFRVVGFALTAAMEFGLFLLAYAVLTPGSIGWRAHLPGALVMTAGWELFKLAGGILLASYVSRATLLYGTIGAVVGLLVFLRLASGLFVFGAELSAVLLDRRAAVRYPLRLTALVRERQGGRQREPERHRQADRLVVSVYSNASGIISSASIVRIAPAANAWIAAIHEPEAPSSATYPRPAASVLAATTITQSSSTLHRDHPPRTRSLEAEIDSGMLDRNTATITATLAVSPVSSEAPITTDSGMPSRTAPSTIPRPPPEDPFSHRSIATSPTKKTSAPAAKPSPTAYELAETVTASSTSS